MFALVSRPDLSFGRHSASLGWELRPGGARTVRSDLKKERKTVVVQRNNYDPSDIRPMLICMCRPVRARNFAALSQGRLSFRPHRRPDPVLMVLLLLLSSLYIITVIVIITVSILSRVYIRSCDTFFFL